MHVCIMLSPVNCLKVITDSLRCCLAGKADTNTKEWLLPQFLCKTLFGPEGK